MKRFLITGLLLAGIGAMPSFAQNRSYQDDIYYNSSDAKKNAANDKQRDEDQRNSDRQRSDNDNNTYSGSGDNYSSNGDYQNYGRSYGSDDYVDYDDDYYYSTNINRFYRPFYNMGYYSGFYNPYWYDPYWTDPYWGWSPWARPGISVSVGWGGPYWSSYWGWYNWYGYSGWGSYWSYPYYGGGWGYGGWCGYGGGYYNGYWNGYYAGLYNYGYGRPGYRNITYGPRYAMNSTHTNVIRNGFNVPDGRRMLGPQQTIGGVSGSPDGRRMISTNNPRNNRTPDAGMDGRADRNTFQRTPDRSAINAGENNSQPGRDYNNGRGNWQQNNNDAAQNHRYFEPAPGNREVSGTRQPDRSNEQQQPRFEQPRQQQQSQPRYEQPRMETPRMSEQRSGGFERSSGGGFGGGHSSGGGFGGGGRSGGGGGGRR